MSDVKLLDCTLRDGGYYNSWDFSSDLIENYLEAMEAISADCIEIGFRSLSNEGYKGACGYSTDDFIQNLNLSKDLNIAVMINAKEIVNYEKGSEAALDSLFASASESEVSLVRIASHIGEVDGIIPAITYLKEKGYFITLNLMQIADRSEEEIEYATKALSNTPLDVFYFADSLGGLRPEQTSNIINTIRKYWKKDIGFHAHDNTCQGLNNSIRAINEGAVWVDGTVTGMGRGPGNVQTEYLTIELEPYRKVEINPTKLYSLIDKYFKPMQIRYGWGTNPFYYLAGKKGIHPTYVQEMLKDPRYTEEDILIALKQLEKVGAKKYNISTLESARHFFKGEPHGTWKPSSLMREKDVLILGTGPGVKTHKKAIETYIKKEKPFVIALNTQSDIRADLIDVRVACHPMRLMADCSEHLKLPQPLITPLSQLPKAVVEILKEKETMDYGMEIKPEKFVFEDTHCVVPAPLVIAYCLAIATSGKAIRILMAGFDGYEPGDQRNAEMDKLIEKYKDTPEARELTVITPSRYEIPKSSVYAI